MKIIFVFNIWALWLCFGCDAHSNTDYLAGKWKCIRVDKSLTKKNAFAEYRQTTMVGTTFEFNNENVLNISRENDTIYKSSHYYTISDDNKFLIYGMLSDIAGFHKIIELNRDSFKMAINFDDTLVFRRIK